MKINYIFKYSLLTLMFANLQAIEHGDTFILKRKDSEKYLSVGVPVVGGVRPAGVNIYANTLEQEPLVKATSRWTIRKVGVSAQGATKTIKPGDKILLENTSTGFYIRNNNEKDVFKFSNGNVGTLSANWESSENIITWNSAVENEITLFNYAGKPGVVYQMQNKIQSVASTPIENLQNVSKFLNEIHNCTALTNGFKDVCLQFTKDKIYNLGITAENGDLYKLEGDKFWAVQNRFPFYAVHPKALNRVLMSTFESVDVDKLGNVVVGDASYFMTALAPWRMFAPMYQMFDGLLTTEGVPTTIYPYSDQAQTIASDEPKEPWSLIKALNPNLKYAKFTNKDVFHALDQTGAEKDMEFGERHFTTYPEEFINTDKKSMRMRNCKIGNGRVLARQLFPSKTSPLLIIDNVKTSSEVTFFTPKNASGQALVVVDYDVDDNGVCWVLDDIGVIYHYKDGIDKNGQVACSATEVFENTEKTLLDRPFKISVAHSGESGDQSVVISIISAVGQLAVGKGTYSSVSVNNLSSFTSETNVMFVGVLSSSVAANSLLSYIHFTTESKLPTRNLYITWQSLVSIADQTIGLASRSKEYFENIGQVKNNSSSATFLNPATTNSFVPKIPTPTLTPVQQIFAGYNSAEIQGYGLLRTTNEKYSTLPYMTKIDGWDGYAPLARKVCLIGTGTNKLRIITGTPEFLEYPEISNNTPNNNTYFVDFKLLDANISVKGEIGDQASFNDLNVFENNVAGYYRIPRDCAAKIDGSTRHLYRDGYNNDTTNPYFGWKCPFIGRIWGGDVAPDSLWLTSLLSFIYTNRNNFWGSGISQTKGMSYSYIVRKWPDAGIWFYAPGNDYPVPGVPILSDPEITSSIAESENGTIWFIDQSGAVKQRTKAGVITTVPGGDVAKFVKIAAAGDASGQFRLVAITSDKKLFACDQGSALTDQQIFGVENATVAINGLCAIQFPGEVTSQAQTLYGGRVYVGWLKGNDPVTGNAYQPPSWPYGTKTLKTLVPDNAVMYKDPIAETLPTKYLIPHYQKAISRGFTVIGRPGARPSEQDWFDPENLADKTVKPAQQIVIAGSFASESAPIKIYSRNDFNAGGVLLEWVTNQADPSVVITDSKALEKTIWLTSAPDNGGTYLVRQNIDGRWPGYYDNVVIGGQVYRGLSFNENGGVNDVGTMIFKGGNYYSLAIMPYVYPLSWKTASFWVGPGNGTNWTWAGENQQLWNKLGAIGSSVSHMAMGQDDTIWFISDVPRSAWAYQDRLPNNLYYLKVENGAGKVLPFPGGQDKNLKKVWAAGDAKNFKLIAIDADGNLYSADQDHELTPEGISGVKEASINKDGLCAIVFPSNTDSLVQMSNKGGIPFIGWIQWANKPESWMYPIAYPELCKREFVDITKEPLQPNYDAAQAKGFAPIGKKENPSKWVFNNNTDRTVIGQQKFAIVANLTTSGKSANRFYQIAAGVGLTGKHIDEQSLSETNLTTVSATAKLNQSDYMREVVASFDGVVAGLVLNCKKILVWKDGSSDPVATISCPFNAIKIACGGFAITTNKATLKLWALDGASGMIYRYTGQDGDAAWQSLNVKARAISGGSVSRLYFVDTSGNLKSCNELGQEVQDFNGGSGKDLTKLCASSNGTNFAVVAIGGPSGQLYSASEASPVLTAQDGLNFVAEASVAHNGLCGINFRSNRWEADQMISGSPTFIGWIDGKKPDNWNPKA